jgi:hypothetical protein
METSSHLRPLAQDASLQDVINAINVDRARQLAIREEPSLRWPHTLNLDTAKVEDEQNLYLG